MTTPATRKQPLAPTKLKSLVGVELTPPSVADCWVVIDLKTWGSDGREWLPGENHSVPPDVYEKLVAKGIARESGHK